MQKSSRVQLDFPNFEDDQLVGKSDQLVGENDQLVGFQAGIRTLVRRIWPQKTAQHFAIHGDVTVRQAERFLAGEQGISLAVFCRLIRGLHGEHFLQLMMGDCQANWWLDIMHERKISAIKQRRDADDDELKELEAKRRRGRA